MAYSICLPCTWHHSISNPFSVGEHVGPLLTPVATVDTLFKYWTSVAPGGASADAFIDDLSLALTPGPLWAYVTCVFGCVLCIWMCIVKGAEDNDQNFKLSRPQSHHAQGQNNP